MTSQNSGSIFDIDPVTKARIGVHFTVGFKNTGRTPAINVVPRYGIFINTNQISVVDSYPDPVYHSFLLPPKYRTSIADRQSFAGCDNLRLHYKWWHSLYCRNNLV